MPEAKQSGTGRKGAVPLPEPRPDLPGPAPEAQAALEANPGDAPPVLLLCGGGDVALEVAPLAHACGFVVDVADHSQESSSAERFPLARRCLTLARYQDLVEVCGIGRGHFVAINTGSASLDREVLAQALGSQARYIGMAGGKTRRGQIYAALRARGVPHAELAAVCCPMGLSIAAQSPQQKAVAVVAELLAVLAGTLNRLRLEG